jgi:hypothetical protein
MYTTQKSNQPMWKDEKGTEIPYNRTTKSERLLERTTAKLAKEALRLNADLAAFKNYVQEVCDEAYEVFMAEKENTKADKAPKGNFTFYNFNRTIKVEVAVHERIDFDDLTIKACKDKLDTFLSDNIESKDTFIKQMVLDAFETSRGNLDPKKVMSLLRYRSKISSPIFQEAMTLLEDSIRRPESKTYFRVWVKNHEGAFKNIDLNFSSI